MSGGLDVKELRLVYLYTEVCDEHGLGSAGIAQFVGFTGFDADATSGGEVVFDAINRHRSMAGLDEKYFQHITVLVGVGDFAGRESRLRKVGEWGEFAVGD